MPAGVRRLAVAVIVLVAGCSGDGGSGGEATRCESASPALLAAISTGIRPETKTSLGPAYAVKSKDFESAYFVSAPVLGPGLDGGDIATWVSNKSDGTGMVFAVGGMAKQFTDWADGASAEAKFSLGDDGAQESAACASD